MSKLYQLLGNLKIKPNLIQTGAISLQLCMDNHAEKIDLLAQQASNFFDVQIERPLSLLTVRHYNKEVLDQLTAGKQLVLRQQTPETIQYVYRGI